MNTEQYKYIQSHQALWQQQGFDYQFAVFLCELMSCSLHDKVIYEREDDIVIEEVSGLTKLIQVKHTYKENENITNSSSDIWKTLDNWYDWIYNYNANGKELNKIELYIITNKHNDNKNELLTAIENVQRGNAETQLLKEVITKLLKLESCKDFCNELLAHEERISPFLMKIKVIEKENPFEDMYERLQARSLKGYDVSNAFEQIIGRMIKLKTNYKGKELSFTVEEFMDQFRDILQKLLLKELTPIEDDDFHIPNNYGSSVMVKQLLSIDAIEENNDQDIELITAYKNYYCYLNSLDAYKVREHIITETTEKQLDSKFIDEWKLIQRRVYRGCKDEESEIKDRGFKCYTTTMEKEINLNGTKISKPFSSGWYLNLSNQESPLVFWRKDWNEYCKR